MYKLIAFDMDGTLLNSEKKIAKSSLETIEKAHRAGKEIVLNTGRCLAELTEHLAILPQVRFVNSVSGALVLDVQKGTHIYEQFLSPDIMQQLISFAEMEQAMPHIMSENSIVQISHEKEMAKYHMGIYQEMFDRVTEKWENLAAQFAAAPFSAAKFNIYHLNVASRERTKQRVLDAGLPVSLAYAEGSSLEVSAKGINKGYGLQKICAHIGISPEEMIVVGDADNDLDALKVAGLAVAMGNSNEHVLQTADVTVADNDHDGCAEAIERYLMRQSKVPCDGEAKK